MPAPQQAVLDLINRLIAREGGTVNDPNDRGGLTRAGITLPTLSRYLGRVATAADLAALDDETIVNIYYTLFWVPNRIYNVYEADTRFGEFLFDWCVNSGPIAIHIFQSFLGIANPDGIIGDETIGVFRHLLSGDPATAYNKFVDYRIKFLVNICVKDHTQISELRGWINRVTNLRYNSPQG